MQKSPYLLICSRAVGAIIAYTEMNVAAQISLSRALLEILLVKHFPPRRIRRRDPIEGIDQCIKLGQSCIIKLNTLLKMAAVY